MALSPNVGSLADVAGGLAVIASRQGSGLNLKIRALAEGVSSFTIQPGDLHQPWRGLVPEARRR